MIVIGSLAAKIVGVLPDWREGKTNDIDLVVKEDQLSHVIDSLSSKTMKVKRFDKFPSHVYILTEDRSLIDISVSDKFYDAILKSSEMTKCVVMGLDALSPDACTLMALKAAYEHLPIHRKKNDLDLSSWREHGICTGKRHQHLIEFVSNTAEENMR